MLFSQSVSSASKIRTLMWSGCGPFNLPPMAVAAGDVLDVLDPAAALEIARQKAGELPHPLSFAARGEQRLTESQVGNLPGQAETQLGIGGCSRLQRATRRDRLQFVESGQHAFDQIGFRRCDALRIVVEEFDGAAQERAIFVQKKNLEPPLPARKDVQPAVVVLSQNAVDGRRAAGVDDSFFAGQHHAELALVSQNLADHFLVAVLENVQRKLRPRKQHYLERKKRQ